MKLTLAVPSNRRVKAETMQSLLELVAHSKHDYHIICPSQGYSIAENRSYIAVKALNNKSDYLLQIDDDMVFPPDTLERLLARDVDIIGVPYFSKQLPRKSVIVLEDGTELKGEVPSELFKCEHVGTGVMLVKMDVFKNIIPPWFAFKTNQDGSTSVGEDAYLCSVARKRGYDIWCDSTLTIYHLGDMEF